MIGDVRHGTCAVCKRDIFTSQYGPCQFVMELEAGVFKRCNKERNDPDEPVDPHTWIRWEHLRDATRDERICSCRHPYHDGMCLPCFDSGVWDLQVAASHPYQPGIIELDHEARE